MSECLSIEELRQYAAGAMAGERLLRADAHVVSCASCRIRLLDPSRLTPAMRSLEEKVRWNPRIEFNCLGEEQAAAYLEGALDATDREIVASHLELCSLCVEDLRAQRAFRAEMSTYPARVYGPTARPALREKLLALWRLPTVRVSFQTAGAAALGMLILFWTAVRPLQTQVAELQRESGQLRQTLAARSQTEEGLRQQITAAEAMRTRLARLEAENSQARHRYQAATTAAADLRTRLARLEQERNTAPGTPGGRPPAAPQEGGRAAPRLAGLTEPLPREVASAFQEWTKQGQVTPSEPARRLLAQLPAGVGPVRGGVGDGDRPEPVSPARTFVLSTRPELAWEPAIAATGYTVALEDPTGRALWTKEVPADENRLPFPGDRPALSAGKEYRWKVEARFANGDRSRSSLAAFRVLAEPRRTQVSRLKARYARFPAVWAAFCQKEGLYDEANRALQQLVDQNRPPTGTASR